MTHSFSLVCQLFFKLVRLQPKSVARVDLLFLFISMLPLLFFSVCVHLQAIALKITLPGNEPTESSDYSSARRIDLIKTS